MRKTYLITFLLLLGLFLVACGGGETPTDEVSIQPVTDEPMEEPTEEPMEEPTEEPMEEPTEAPAEEPMEAMMLALPANPSCD